MNFILGEKTANKRLHRTNFRCHFFMQKNHKTAIKNLLGEPGVNVRSRVAAQS
jgi:hypothetical protein